MAPTPQDIALARQTLENFAPGGDWHTAVKQADALLVLAQDERSSTDLLLERLLQAGIVGAHAEVGRLDRLVTDLIALVESGIDYAAYICQEFIKHGAADHLTPPVLMQTLFTVIKPDLTPDISIVELVGAIMTNRGEQTVEQKRNFKRTVENLVEIARGGDPDASYALALMIRLDDSSTISSEKLGEIAIFLLGNDEIEHVLNAEDRRGSLVNALDARNAQRLEPNLVPTSRRGNGQRNPGDFVSLSAVVQRADPDSSRPILCPDRL